MKTYFDHEKLDVYQEAITFCGWVGEGTYAFDQDYDHEQDQK